MVTSRKRDGAALASPWRRALTLGLIVLVGINLRTVLLAVPPILPLLSHDLRLSYTAVGFLTSLPTLIMGVASLPTGILIGRLGGRAMVAFGLALIALGAILRAIWPEVLPIYFFTAVLSLGSTFSQTAIPALIRQWFSTRIGFATALYSDGMVIGEMLGAVLTIPLVLGWLGSDAWTGSFVFWSIPVVVVLALWLWLAPSSTIRRTDNALESVESLEDKSEKVAVRSAYINPWTLGLLLGGAQLIYFGTNAWIPSYNQALHVSALTSLSLGALNATQIPASLVVTIFAERLVGRKSPFVVAGTVGLASLAGWVWTPVFLQPLWAGLLGSSAIVISTLGLALPALLAKQEEVGRWTGKMLTVSYIFAFLGPFIGGTLLDLTHLPTIAFLPQAVAAGVVIVLGVFLPLQKGRLPIASEVKTG